MSRPRETAGGGDPGRTTGSLSRNAAASLVGNTWAAMVAVVLVPIYIKLLGIEAWGMIGLFVSLQAFCTLLDLGLSATLTREIARLSVRPEMGQRVRDLTRTLELIYWAIAVLIGVGVFLLAPLIAHHWVESSDLGAEDIGRAIQTMAVALCLQWPFALYSGGLLGLQRQVLLAAIIAGMTTLRGAGTVVILWTVSPTLQAFFLWQIGIAAAQTCVTGVFLWRNLPPAARRAAFRAGLLADSWRFALGIGGMTVLSVLLTQLDKIVLSRFMSLETFGYYTLASAVGASVYLIVLPVYSALYPRFTQLVSLGDDESLGALYHRSCQLMSALILPVGIVLVLFSRQLLFTWTGDAATVEHTHRLLSVLAAGTTLNGLMYLPYALQFAHGWTRLALGITLVALALLTPLIIEATVLYGAIGAASAWVGFHGAALLVGIQLMHRRLRRGELGRWYREDVGLPLVVALGTAGICFALAPSGGTRLQQLAVLVGASALVASVTLLATPVTRLALTDYLSRRRAAALEIS